MFRFIKIFSFSQGLWLLFVLLIASFVLLPLAIIVSNLFLDSKGVFQHLLNNLFFEYVCNTLLLFLGVGTLSGIMGISTAWFVTMYSFPLKKILEWALVLPLAIPTYLAAYVYTDLLSYSGPVQSLVRSFLGNNYSENLIDIKNIGGAVLLFSLVLYPYVYISCRAAFIEQSICFIEVAKTLGKTRIQVFIQIALPLARPAMIAGLSLVLMETIADFGGVDYFAIDTFTTGIYRAWFAMDSQVGASQLAACLLLFVFILIFIERWSRRRKSYQNTNRYCCIDPKVITGMKGWFYLFIFSIPFLGGFLIPVVRLLYLNFIISEGSRVVLSPLAWNSFLLAITTALFAGLISLLVCYGCRMFPSVIKRQAIRFILMGYALPGTVIAIGVLIPFNWLDHRVGLSLQKWFQTDSALIFSGSLFILIFAYLVRFLSVSMGSVEAGLGKVGNSIDSAAKSLGSSSMKLIRKIHLPMIKASFLSAMLMVFVDVMKELPATLILRPFNYDTLAVRVYHLASDERLADAAAPSLLIVVVGIFPVIIISRIISRARPGS